MSVGIDGVTVAKGERVSAGQVIAEVPDPSDQLTAEPTLGHPVAGRDFRPETLSAIILRRLALDGSNRQPKFIIPTIADRLAKGMRVEGLALASALWCAYCEGTTESGAEIEPNDPNWDRLQAQARADLGKRYNHIHLLPLLEEQAESAATHGQANRG